MTPVPFLRWAGGKTASLPALLAVLPPTWGAYHEPFVGGGALWWALAGRSTATLADTNDNLVRTYRGVRDDVDSVLDRLDGMQAEYQRVGEGLYYTIRANPPPSDALAAAVAAWVIFLNKAGFNGLYRVNTKGGYNVPVGRDGKGQLRTTILAPGDADNLRACARALAPVDLRCQDYADTLAGAREGDLVYCDPPYLPAGTGGFTTYTAGGFTPDDHARLARAALAAKRRGVHVLLSNAGSVVTAGLYPAPDWLITPVQVRRNISRDGGGRDAVTEYLIR